MVKTSDVAVYWSFTHDAFAVYVDGKLSTSDCGAYAAEAVANHIPGIKGGEVDDEWFEKNDCDWPEKQSDVEEL